MKILQVITSLHIGGAEKLITEIAPLLRAKGHEVDILAIDGDKTYFLETLLSQGFKVITLGEKCNPYHPKFLFKIIGIMRNYDIVHTHLTSAQLFVAIGSLFSRKPTLFTTEHNTTNRRRDSKLYWLFDKWMYSRYKKVICISDKTYENLDRYMPGMKNLCLIYNGVNIRRFRDAKALQEKNSTGKTIVTMVAAFRPQKDHKTLIKAMKLLPKERFELWIVGDGELHDQIHSYVEEMDMSDSVVFWGNRPDIPEILHASDIIVLSSHYEGLSLSSIEGMSVGKPFIATDVDGLHEIVVDAGILVPHLDEKTLANEILRLDTDKSYYDDIANRCWQKAQSYDIVKMVDEYESLYLSYSS